MDPISLIESIDPAKLPGWLYAILMILAVLSNLPGATRGVAFLFGIADDMRDRQRAELLDIVEAWSAFDVVRTSIKAIASTGSFDRVILFHAQREVEGWVVSSRFEVTAPDVASVSSLWDGVAVDEAYPRQVIDRVVRTDDPITIKAGELEEGSQLRLSYDRDGISMSVAARVYRRPDDDPTSVWFLSAGRMKPEPVDSLALDRLRVEVARCRRALRTLAALPIASS